MPGVGGNVISYRDLAQYTSDDQPFYALQSRGLSGIEDPLGSVEEIAAAFIAEMREVRPKGPYILVGQCMGGIIAYEMAQQLVASGDEVPLLALIETWVPEAPKARLIRPGTRVLAMLRFAGDRFRLYREEMSRLGMRQRIAYVLYRMRMFAVMITRLDPFRGDRSEFVQRVVTEANLAAHQQYQPRAYAGRVVLFCAEGRRVSEDQDRRLAWGQLITGELSVHTLPGDDSGRMLMDPHVRILSQQFNAYVERAQAASLSETHA